DEPARQSLGLTLQNDASEEQVGGRTADVDADGAQFDRVLLPDRAGDRVAISLGHLVMFVLQFEIVHALSDLLKWPGRWRGASECGRSAFPAAGPELQARRTCRSSASQRQFRG